MTLQLLTNILYNTIKQLFLVFSGLSWFQNTFNILSVVIVYFIQTINIIIFRSLWETRVYGQYFFLFFQLLLFYYKL